MKLTKGRIVLYKLSRNDCDKAEEMTRVSGVNHPGNRPSPGEVVPAIVVVAWNDHMFNGQAFLDGRLTLWLTSVREGDGQGEWMWPTHEDRPAEEYWFCIIGPANLNRLPSDQDSPMRNAVLKGFREATGHDAGICSSGWGITKEMFDKLRQTLYNGS